MHNTSSPQSNEASDMLSRQSGDAIDGFDESQFLPQPDARDAYERAVRLGYDQMRTTRVVIAGLARNIADVLPITIRRIERLGKLFDDYRVVVYENDSADKTRSILYGWTKANYRVQAICEDRTDPINLPTRCLSRAARMSLYRSLCQHRVRLQYSHMDHVILVDMDLEGGWSYDGVAHTFGHTDWDFVGSYGVIYRRHLIWPNALVHYDAWAYRNDSYFTPLTTKVVNHLLFHRGQPFQRVYSCFGGLGVYRMPVYLAGQYDGTDVEHASFHRDLYHKGYREIFLNPNQIVLYGRKHRSWDPQIKQLLRRLAAIQGKQPVVWQFEERLGNTMGSSLAHPNSSRAA